MKPGSVQRSPKFILRLRKTWKTTPRRPSEGCVTSQQLKCNSLPPNEIGRIELVLRKERREKEGKKIKGYEHKFASIPGPVRKDDET